MTWVRRLGVDCGVPGPIRLYDEMFSNLSQGLFFCVYYH